MPQWEYKCTRCRETYLTDNEYVKDTMDPGNIPHSIVQNKPRCNGKMLRVWSDFTFRIDKKDTP